MGTIYLGNSSGTDSNVYTVDNFDIETLKLNGTTITSTAAELNTLDASVNNALMTVGTGISGATGEVVQYSIYRIGGIIYTQIMVDITGLNDGGTAGDIIGKDGGTANCHFGQITAAINGTIWGGDIRCFETPAGGNTDIDVYSATEATGAQDAAITGLTETALVNAGAHAAGTIDYFTGVPAADEYLYLVNGTATDADYTAGRFLITLYGLPS